jgi:lipoprotein-anchoring transpeptidase ErfK/SrfK
MWKWGTTTGLKTLSLLYLVSASAFGLAAALQAQQPWAVASARLVAASGPVLREAARTVQVEMLFPAFDWALRTKAEAVAWLNPPPPAVAPVVAQAVVKPVPKAPPKAVVTVKPSAPVQTLELAESEAAVPPLEPAPDANPPAPGEIARVLTHLKTGLTQELYDNFSLFLYVSKANHGPWSQRMFVFDKQASGDLKLLYAFPVSTGAEVLMPSPSGRMLHTNTTPGYFELDPGRMYRRYHSSEWDHPMPYTMFFNWEHDGLQTGLAIHSATGSDVALLGQRASAGCVRLHPQNARLLFTLIKQNYRGRAPRFAYDTRTATMANNGLLMHGKDGKPQFAEGYKVLVLIENNGGTDMVAALF